MLELLAQSEEDVESWKASLLRAGVYPTRSAEEEQSNSPVSGRNYTRGENVCMCQMKLVHNVSCPNWPIISPGW